GIDRPEDEEPMAEIALHRNGQSIVASGEIQDATVDECAGRPKARSRRLRIQKCPIPRGGKEECMLRRRCCGYRRELQPMNVFSFGSDGLMFAIGVGPERESRTGLQDPPRVPQCCVKLHIRLCY